MKNNFIFFRSLFLVVLGLTGVLLFCHQALFAETLKWQELKSEHFIVNFINDDYFIRDVLSDAENYYRGIASDLGYPRYDDFWTWDKRIKIYIYPDQASYLKATGQPEWSKGMADYTNKQIASFSQSGSFLDSILPHEIAHLTFRDFVGFKGEVPLWLDEGVAQWSEVKKRDSMKQMIKFAYEKDGFLSINDMMKLDIRSIKDNTNVFIRPSLTKEGNRGVLILSSANLVTTYYLQAVSLVGFLIEQYGFTQFPIFCRQLRDGKSLEEALRFAYPDHIKNINEFEDNWREYLAKM